MHARKPISEVVNTCYFNTVLKTYCFNISLRLTCIILESVKANTEIRYFLKRLWTSLHLAQVQTTPVLYSWFFPMEDSLWNACLRHRELTSWRFKPVFLLFGKRLTSFYIYHFFSLHNFTWWKFHLELVIF